MLSILEARSHDQDCRGDGCVVQASTLLQASMGDGRGQQDGGGLDLDGIADDPFFIFRVDSPTQARELSNGDEELEIPTRAVVLDVGGRGLSTSTKDDLTFAIYCPHSAHELVPGVYKAVGSPPAGGATSLTNYMDITRVEQICNQGKCLDSKTWLSTEQNKDDEEINHLTPVFDLTAEASAHLPGLMASSQGKRFVVGEEHAALFQEGVDEVQQAQVYLTSKRCNFYCHAINHRPDLFSDQWRDVLRAPVVQTSPSSLLQTAGGRSRSWSGSQYNRAVMKLQFPKPPAHSSELQSLLQVSTENWNAMPNMTPAVCFVTQEELREEKLFHGKETVDDGVDAELELPLTGSMQFFSAPPPGASIANKPHCCHGVMCPLGTMAEFFHCDLIEPTLAQATNPGRRIPMSLLQADITGDGEERISAVKQVADLVRQLQPDHGVMVDSQFIPEVTALLTEEQGQRVLRTRRHGCANARSGCRILPRPQWL